MIVLYGLVALVILLVMIVIHELGHYVAGKILKFKINEFSVGFGPTIFSHASKKTGEKFSLRLIPLGGYCAFEDEDGLGVEKEKAEKQAKIEENIFPEISSDNRKEQDCEILTADTALEQSKAKPRSFTEEKPWKRIIVLVAGAFFNFVSAIIFSFIFIWVMGYNVPVVNELYTDEAGILYASELQSGDIIHAVDGEKITVMKTYSDLTKDKTVGKTYSLTIERNGEIKQVNVEVKRIVNRDYKDENGKVTPLDYNGLGFQSTTKSMGGSFGMAMKYCVPYTFKLAFLVLASFGSLITGALPINALAGPVGTIGYMAELGMYDMRNFLVLLPLIAANLAVFNILPIPSLDGSKVIFATIEWIRGKPISRKIEGIIHAVGIMFLLCFVVIIDIVGIFI